MPDRPTQPPQQQTHAHRSRSQERIDELDTSPSHLLTEIESLKAQLDEARRQSDEYLGALQRERAEFLNFKRRTAEERERELGLAGEDLLRKVIAVADDFDRAIDAQPADLEGNAWAEGIGAIDRKLGALLESEGVSPIEAGPGQTFDPREHDAIANVSGSGRREGEIVEEVRRGYRVRDRVLRPALVAVASSTDGDRPQVTTSDTPDNANDND